MFSCGSSMTRHTLKIPLKYSSRWRTTGLSASRTRSIVDEWKSFVLRRHFSSEAPALGDYTLYQYAICPYCNIAKTMLHYGGIPYKAVEVNPLTKNEIKNLDKSYRKVPILTKASPSEESGPEQLNGSEKIVEQLLGDFSGSSSKLSQIDTDSPESQRWTTFARDDLAPLLYPNLCNTLGNSYRAFGYVHDVPHFSTLQKLAVQNLGAVAMYMAASKIKKKRNIEDEKAALMEALEDFHEYLQESTESAPESLPHLGELTIYGVLRGLRGLAVFDTVMEAYPTTIQPWFQRMESIVEESS